MATEIAPRPLLAEAAERARRLGRPVLVSHTRRVPACDPLAVFASLQPTERMLWLRPASGESLVGAGAAHALVGAGPEHIARTWRDLVRDALIDAPEQRPWTGPLVLGGFAFDPLRPASAHWTGFPAARLVVPSTLLAQRDGQAWETTTFVVGGHGQPSQARTPGAACAPPARDWQALVADAARGIRDGSLGLEKLVLAREEHVEVDVEPEPCLRRLAEEYPTCTLFALEHDGACFLGATPERLAQVEGGIARTMALAGSIGRGVTPAEDERLARTLLASPKERAEHAVVVRALREALSTPGLCTHVSDETEPRLARLPNVQHLLTPMQARLAPGKCLLDLVARLHPSPAVAGFPQAQALPIIREREGFDRGWYGGPLGWLNAAGEGEFVVAIRSGLLRGREAWLYAGCGIVADCDPAAEYAESELKLRPMRSALGLAPA